MKETDLALMIRIAIASVLFGCNTGKSKGDYYNYYTGYDSRSYIEKTEGGIRYLLQYRPEEYLALKQYKGEEDISQNEFNKILDDYNDHWHFCMRFIRVDTGNVLEYNLRHKGEYYNRLALLSNGFSSLVTGVTSNSDTLYSAYHHYERTFNLRPFEQVLFSIPKNKDGIPDKLIFDDKLFSGARIEFENFKDLLFNQPQLRL